MLIFRGVECEVHEENEVGDLDVSCVHDFGWLDGNYENLDNLNKSLEEFNLPPLSEWDEDDDSGHYCCIVNVDKYGTPMEGSSIENHYYAIVEQTSDPIPYSLGAK